MRIDVVTIFPDYLAALDLSLVGKARRAGLLDLRVHDLRDWTTDRHRTVDDTPFGGGAGMVMRPDVWGQALDELLTDPAEAGAGDEAEADVPPVTRGAHLVVPTPSGEVFTQRRAEELATEDRLVIACGRYEGIDARVVERYRASGHRVSELSIGDYVLNGGEVAALVMVEAVGRLLPGVVGNPHSLVEESHGAAGLLEYPVYTKPPRWQDRDVPEVLLSGHHARIERWRRDRALERTAARRPDMIAALDPRQLDAHDRDLLAALGWREVVEDPRGGEGHDGGTGAGPALRREHVAE
ncbi:tRNA (guanosine(37)-N1)-methyltransferase TrmD [Isoptericola halotolerans]|uniref:tRNA (guanine-N(1)-)-methyltransferase n=1 Tax=Isoptericola halotolerans TaxID=300560 RepID=A0ABX2A1S6_9MICO|nr:tRNA (guanine37-N1)-methyltransferase [Isoptericola halotolerans]